MNEGWKCPVCGKVNAPWKESCNCNTNQHTWYPIYPVYPLPNEWGTGQRPWEPPYKVTC